MGILRDFHAARQKPATVKFDKEKSLKTLHNRSSSGFRAWSGLACPRSSFTVDTCRSTAIARGMAAANKGPLNIVHLQSKDLQRREGSKLFEPLLHDRTLIIVHEGASSISSNLATYWPQFVRNPKSYSAPITERLVLNCRLAIETAGAVIVLQR